MQGVLCMPQHMSKPPLQRCSSPAPHHLHCHAPLERLPLPSAVHCQPPAGRPTAWASSCRTSTTCARAKPPDSLPCLSWWHMEERVCTTSLSSLHGRFSFLMHDKAAARHALAPLPCPPQAMEQPRHAICSHNCLLLPTSCLTRTLNHGLHAALHRLMKAGALTKAHEKQLALMSAWAELAGYLANITLSVIKVRNNHQ